MSLRMTGLSGLSSYRTGTQLLGRFSRKLFRGINIEFEDGTVRSFILQDRDTTTWKVFK